MGPPQWRVRSHSAAPQPSVPHSNPALGTRLPLAPPTEGTTLPGRYKSRPASTMATSSTQSVPVEPNHSWSRLPLGQSRVARKTNS